MELLTLDDEKYINFISRYDLNYWVRRPVKYLQISPLEFENDIKQIIDIEKRKC